MLFGRVTDHTTRTNLRATPMNLKLQNPFQQAPGFKELDQLVHVDFLESLPANYRHLGLSEDGALDTDLYMVHVVPHA